jgi:hypothetical protein
MIVIGPPMKCREDADREPVYEDRMRMPFPRVVVLMLLSVSASARSVGTVVAGGVRLHTDLSEEYGCASRKT